jgi:TRAP transporter 4TM/12TM fusion protein
MTDKTDALPGNGTENVMPAYVVLLFRAYCAFLFVGGIAWILDIPDRLGLAFIQYEWLAPYLGVAVAAVHLRNPYFRRSGPVEIVIGIAGIAAWIWSAAHTESWMFSLTGNSPDKIIPGAIALLAMMEALRKACGLSITLLVWGLVGYGLLGHHLPQPFQANYTDPKSMVMYLYTDVNAVIGIIIAIVATLVLAFMVFGRMLEVSGATAFFTDICLSLMGHRRGGPAKVAVIASGLFGSVSSSAVGNIMSTGVVTIPLMRRTGFRAHQAAAIEAVASTGGQIAPPVMGATAFIMAEFLQISYVDVVMAALLPAIFYYVCLYFHVDGLARAEGHQGIPASELPRAGATLKKGWIFILPLAWLIYLLFWRGSQPAFAALGSAAVLLGLSLVKGHFRTLREWRRLILDGGEAMLPILMIGGGAGVVVGIMNLSGLAQSLSFLLTQAGSSLGLLAVLVLAAILSIILGMGMPSTAIYVVLATVIGPTLSGLGVTPIAAHLFIFYFGVLSFLTPPVAVASYVAAGLAGAGMWQTGWLGLRYSAVAYVLPFLWCYEPALLLDGSWQAIGVTACAVLAAIALFSKGEFLEILPTKAGRIVGMLLAAVVAGFVAAAPAIFGAVSVPAIAITLAALAAAFLPQRIRDRQPSV